jgi:hypothetical protein
MIDDMGENTFWYKIWSRILLLGIVITICTTIYSIVDRIGPVRPIVTLSQSYQAK